MNIYRRWLVNLLRNSEVEKNPAFSDVCLSIKKLRNPTFSDICLSIIKEISKEIKKFEIFRCLLVNAERCNSPYRRSWPNPVLAQDRHGAGDALDVQDGHLDEDAHLDDG